MCCLVLCSWEAKRILSWCTFFNCRNWHIGSSSISGKTIETTGWSISYLDHFQNRVFHLHLQLRFHLHLFVLQLYLLLHLVLDLPLSCWFSTLSDLMAYVLDLLFHPMNNAMDQRKRKYNIPFFPVVLIYKFHTSLKNSLIVIFIFIFSGRKDDCLISLSVM